MSKAKKKTKAPERVIAQNKKARHDYTIDSKVEAGLELAGWEVKSCREGKVQLRDSYIVFERGEAFLVGAHISPLNTASTHVVANPTRQRKLLLNRREIDRLSGHVDQQGFTVVALDLHWKAQYIKCEIALVKGKKMHDKRASLKEKDWNRQKERIMKHNV